MEKEYIQSSYASCRRKRKTVGGECLLKKTKNSSQGYKSVFGKAFLPSYQALSDNTYTITLQSVLRISYPE